MRGYFIAIAVAVATAFSAGYLTLALYRAPDPAADDADAAIRRFKAAFRATHDPVSEVDLASLPLGLAFLDPRNLLPQVRRYSFDVMAALWRAEEDCSAPHPQGDEMLRKAAVWREVRCGRRASLPRDFLTTPPFFHPLGGTYARRLWEAGQPITGLHVLELADTGATLEPPLALLATLSPDALSAIVADAELFLAPDRVLVRQGEKLRATLAEPGGRRYAVFARGEWNAFWATTPYVATQGAEGSCVLREGETCWRLQAGAAWPAVRRPLALLLVFSSLLAAVAVYQAVRRFRRQNQEEERKRFALQALTHELRTPLSSLSTASEELLARYDDFPDRLQGTLLSLCNDVERLKRLAETSRHYLEAGETLLRLRPQAVASLNGFLHEQLERYGAQVELAPLAKDRAFSLDPYWVGLCVRNLVDNALRHGRPPVRVALDARAGVLELRVTDAGPSPNARPGMGLGLSIVRTALRAMRSELHYSRNPTCFRFLLTEAT